MTFALTKVQCYGQEAEEPLNKRYRQFMMLTITAANTDTVLDLGENQTGSLGTFWTAVSGSAPGAGALTAIQDIVTRAESFASWGGNWINRAQVDGSGANVVTYTSAASAGGAAAEAYTVTGLAATDTINAVFAKSAGANNVSIRATGSPGTNALTVTYTGDPGAGATVGVTVTKAGTTTTPGAGTFTVTFANKTPDITFASGDAPTSYEVSLEWILQPQVSPVEYYATA